MKRYLPLMLFFFFICYGLMAVTDTKKREANLSELSSCVQHSKIPFKAKGNFLSVWDGRDYTPLFIKGINLGVSIPGTYPGELAATREQYQRWFKEIKEIGYNCIQLYTLHFPRFYQELFNYNIQHPESPLLVIQGVWLDELSNQNLYSQTSSFEQEIEYVIDCVHGNKIISSRLGKAYGNYSSDISQWVIAYSIGREVYPSEVRTTNSQDAGSNSYNGSFLSISTASPTETWVTARMDKVIAYEHSNYDVQRPVCFSSWAALDPLDHPTELNYPDSQQDKQEIDFIKINGSKAEAGFYVNYHAYPYFPDFISDEPSYQTKQDFFGPNSYLGYLMDLKSHYEDVPLIIGEFGVPTSWGIAHFAHSKMHQGGITEELQGLYSIRMLDNIQEAELAGGIQFSWLDEWFKNTWITAPLSNSDSRPLWHNITTPEQNYGLVSFAQKIGKTSSIGKYSSTNVSEIKTSADPTYFNVVIRTNTDNHLEDDYWLAIDTHDKNAGESILPNGQSISNRAEFALKINLSDTIARLYVTKAYDVFNVNSDVREGNTISTVTNGEPWELVRWRTNYSKNNIQYIGKIKVEHIDKPYSFLSGVNWNSDSICVRLPWTLINFRDPSQMEVMHYTSEKVGSTINVLTTDKVSDGIALTLSLNNEKFQTSRFKWDTWNISGITNNPPLERQKRSVLYIREHLRDFNNAPLAQCDSYSVLPNGLLEVDVDEGLLSNDLDYDGDELEVVQPYGYTTFKGNLFLHPNGSFVYEPANGQSGDDEFMYYASDGEMYSKLVTVTITIKDNNVGTGNEIIAINKDFRIYPNPGNGLFNVKISGFKYGIKNLMIYNSTGQLVKIINRIEDGEQINLNNQQSGIFYLKFLEDGKQVVKRIVKI